VGEIAGGDDAYFEQLDLVLTNVIRLARHPRMAELMSAGIDVAVDRRLFVLLNLIADRGPMRASELVDLMAVDQSTVSRQLAALVDAGLVSRAVDPTDRRAALVEVTPVGREAMSVARTRWRHTLADLAARWSPEQRMSLLGSLRDLGAGLEQLLDRPAPPPTLTRPHRTDEAPTTGEAAPTNW
jgi:DNA-binding MarR family transcriptional regulator